MKVRLPGDMLPLRLGADAVQLLIPHRRPFLFVDGVLGYQRVPGSIGSALVAMKAVGANEPVFEGHFRGSGERPGFALWPGVYTAEGLGQSCNLLLVLLAIEEELEKAGRTSAQALASIRALERLCRPDLGRPDLGRPDLGRPDLGPPKDGALDLLARLGDPASRIGLAGALEIKWIEPVLAGATLHYEVRLTHAVGSGRRFDIEARVDERPVARGTLTSSTPQRS